jgi:hypothetical protein
MPLVLHKRSLVLTCMHNFIYKEMHKLSTEVRRSLHGLNKLIIYFRIILTIFVFYFCFMHKPRPTNAVISVR